MSKPFNLESMRERSVQQRPHPLRSDYARLRRLYDEVKGGTISRNAVARREGLDADLLAKIWREMKMQPRDTSTTARQRARMKQMEGAR